MYQPKDEGRATRRLNCDNLIDLKQAKSALILALASDDPAEIKAAIVDAYNLLEGMTTNMNQIEINCALAAKRGENR